MLNIQAWLSLLRFSRDVAAYTAAMLCAAIVLLLSLIGVREIIFGGASYSTLDIFMLAAVTLTLVVPVVWLTTFILAYFPVLLTAGLHRLLQSRSGLSHRARYWIIYAAAIGFSIPIAALVWSMSFDGWTWFWPLIIIIVAAGACRELINQAGNEPKYAD
jgi:hypothetical protein